MLSEQKVRELLHNMKDPFLHKTFKETDGIEEITIKPDKNHVSVKLAIAKTNTAEQMQLQQELVGGIEESRCCDSWIKIFFLTRGSD